jgi:AAA+ superfamily predicted ATPase
MATKSQTLAADVAALLRARVPIIVIETQEESRVERYLLESAAAARYIPRTWDCGQGVADMAGKVSGGLGSPDIGDTLDFICNRANGSERGLWIMRDVLPWITPPIGTMPLRKLCNFARLRPTMPAQSAQAIILLVTGGTIPPELKGHATVINWALPDRDEIASCLREAINVLPEAERDAAAPNGVFDAACDAAVGLPEAEAASAFGRSLVMTRKIDPAIIAGEKKRIVSREKVLELVDPLPGGFTAIGGLENVKAFSRTRKLAYKASARAYGLPSPKGIFVTGVPGNGKSMMAKAMGTEFDCPVVKFDPGALKSKFVGESEANIRRAIATIEAMGKVIVWIDEIEKGLQGATSGSADGGTSADQLGALLNWMQERRGEAFIVATSNDAEALPPELLRKGRFDEVFFVDNPAPAERSAILSATLKTNNRTADCVDCTAVADATADFSGAELAALIPEAMFQAFADGERQITTADVLTVAKTVVPLAKQAEKKIARLRDWAKGRCRPASAVTEESKPQLRAVDF